MQVMMRISGTTLAGLDTAATFALNDFFGATAYTYEFTVVSADSTFENGKPTGYFADLQANSAE